MRIETDATGLERTEDGRKQKGPRENKRERVRSRRYAFVGGVAESIHIFRQVW